MCILLKMEHMLQEATTQWYKTGTTESKNRLFRTDCVSLQHCSPQAFNTTAAEK